MLKDSGEVTVFRVEHTATGRGPYRDEFYDDLELMHVEHCSGSHPSPRRDGMEEFLWTEMLFAFKSMEQLDAWFEPKFKEMMHDLGFIIREYRVAVDSVEYGEFQVAFQHEHSTLCGEKKLLDHLVPLTQS